MKYNKKRLIVGIIFVFLLWPIIMVNIQIERLELKLFIFSIILIIYWFFLLIKYEKEATQINLNKFVYDEEYILKKYNPLLAGCIQGKREVLSRDIIAILINLISKKIVKLENIEKSNSGYQYYLKKIKKNENKMDFYEKYVYDWFFENEIDENVELEIIGQVELKEKLDRITNKNNSKEKFEQLNELVMKKCKKLGVNCKKVPQFLLYINNFLFVLCLVLCCIHIKNYLDYEYMLNTTIGNLILCLILLSVVIISSGRYYIFTKLISEIYINIRHLISNKLNSKITKKIITTIISVILVHLILFIIVFILQKSFIIDVWLMCIANIIILTDNLMVKSEKIMINDIEQLNYFKRKLKNSLLFDKDVGDVVLWDKYLAYAISFGISPKTFKYISDFYIDDDLKVILEYI